MKIYELIKLNNHRFNISELNLDNDYILTIKDVEEEKICKKYNSKVVNTLSNYGLYVNADNDILFLYNKVDRIEIKSSEDKVSCHGGNIHIECFAIINVYNNDTIYDTIIHKINPLYSCTNCEFSSSTNTISINENRQYENRTVIIDAKYGYMGTIYKDTLIISQEPNHDSEWIENGVNIKKIVLESNTNIVPRNGGIVNLKVSKISSVKLFKKDSFGFISKTKNSDDIITDITNDCNFQVNNPFVVKNNDSIIFPPQTPSSPARKATIICKYEDYVKTLDIEQEKGAILKYDTLFSFDDGKFSKSILLDKSIDTSLDVKIISCKIRLLDDIETDRIDNFNISFKCTSDWVTYYFDEENSTLKIIVSKNNELSVRNCTLLIENNSKILNLSISQPPKTEIRYEYNVIIDSKDNISSNEVEYNKILFIPQKTTYYDDGSKETINYLEPYNKIDVLFNTDNDNRITITKPKLIDFNGVHESKLIYVGDSIYDDININIKCRVYGDNILDICNVSEKNILFKCIKPIKKDVEVTITVNNLRSNDCISSSNNPTFSIIDSKGCIIYESKISKFWVDDEMNQDVVYCGNVTLYEGEEYTFIVSKYTYLDSTTDLLQEKYLIEPDDIGIDLTINL